MLIILLMGVLLAAFSNGVVFAQDEDVAAPPLPNGPLDFDDCVQLAIKQSPYFLKSSMEIDVRRLDESNSKWSFIPNISVSTTYYVELDRRSGRDKPGSALVFTSGAYNPVVSYFSLKAYQMVTKVAILGHQKAIDKGIYELAQQFLELDHLDQMEALQSQIIDLTGQKKAFVEKLAELETVAPLEIQIADQELVVAEAEVEKIIAARELVLAGLSQFLGVGPLTKSDLDVARADRQVLNEFDPQAATLKQTQKNSFDLKIQELKNLLQKRHIQLAYAKFMPTLSLGMKNPDPLSSSDTQQDLYLSVGVSVPIYQGMKRVNDIKRQKMVLNQYRVDKSQLKNDVSTQWKTAQNKLQAASTGLKLARSAEKLASLKVRQNEIMFKSGDQYPLSKLLDARIAHNNTQIKALAAQKEYNQAVLALRQLTGDLFSNYVKVVDSEE